ncbi:hypothetical protein OHA98_19200 [Streptomyces sp. NBC_00654]|nr:hypothetical protein [Streptomyces sp. NBC_00654]MCX4966918.1 hypothetical protein [Streptomyces sp. NBC_00654]
MIAASEADAERTGEEHGLLPDERGVIEMLHDRHPREVSVTRVG